MIGTIQYVKKVRSKSPQGSNDPYIYVELSQSEIEKVKKNDYPNHLTKH